MDALDKVLNFLSEFNLQTIVSMGVIVWYFTRDVKSSVDNLDKDVREMNTRISRLEGSVYGRHVYEQIKDNK
jgi:hypothetical protein